MSSLRAGKPALVISASTPHGRANLVGKVVNLIERIIPAMHVATGLYYYEHPLTGKKITVSSEAPIWLAQRDGYTPVGVLGSTMGRPFTILERHLMPLDENDPDLVEMFKVDVTTVMNPCDVHSKLVEESEKYPQFRISV